MTCSPKLGNLISRLDTPEAQRRLRAWMLTTSARPYLGRLCLEKLRNPRHHCNSNQCYSSASGRRTCDWAVLDHPEWWRGPQGEFIVTSHPYNDTNGQLETAHQVELGSLQTLFSCTVTVSTLSWYAPGLTMLVTLRGKENDTE